MNSFSISLPNGIQNVNIFVPNSERKFCIYPLSNVLTLNIRWKLHVSQHDKVVCINKLVMGLPFSFLYRPKLCNLCISSFHVKSPTQQSSSQQHLPKSKLFPIKCKLQVQTHQRNENHSCQSSWKKLWL